MRQHPAITQADADLALGRAGRLLLVGAFAAFLLLSHLFPLPWFGGNP